jgi:hypothetical protein
MMVWLLLWACSSQQEERDAEAAGVQAEMQAHRAEADAIREAIIFGKLDAAKAAGQQLSARLPIPDLPAAPQAAADQAAAALAASMNLEEVAGNFSRLSAACGSCHTAQGAKPQLDAPRSPPVSEGFDEQMQRYHWAAERMWQGLVLPSEEAFEEARAALRGIPTDHFLPDIDLGLPVVAEAMDEAVHEQAALASTTAPDPYAAMLLTCALCHLHSPASPAHD